MAEDLWSQLNSSVAASETVNTDQWSQLKGSLGQAPSAELPAIKPNVERSAFMEPVTSTIAGVTDLAEQFARAYRMGDVPGRTEDDTEPGYLGQFANWLILNKDRFEKDHPYLYAPVKDESEARRYIREGVRSIVPSLGAGVPGMLVGAAAGGGPIGAIAGYALSGGTIFGLAEYDQFIQDVVEHNKKNPSNQIPEDVYKSAAIKSAIMEAGLEAVSDAVEAGSFGFGKVVTTPMKETISSILKQGWKQGGKNFLMAQAKAQPAEILTEMGQNYSETALRQSIGVETPQTPWQAAVDAIGPTFVSTILIGAGSHTLDARRRGKLVDALTDPTTDFDDRFNAMKFIYTELQKIDKDNNTSLAHKWGEVAQEKLLNSQPIDIDQNVLTMPTLAETKVQEAKAEELNADVQKFVERGQPKAETPEVIPPEEQKPEDDKTVRQTMGLETRKMIFDKFLEQGFDEARANELASMVMGAKGPMPPVTPTVKSVILGENGQPIEKVAPQETTNDTINNTPGQTLIQNLPENLKNSLIVSVKGTPFSSPGAVKIAIKKAGNEQTHVPFMVAQGEWVGVPAQMSQMVGDLAKITTDQLPVQRIQTPGQTFTARQSVPTQANPLLRENDLTRNGTPYTNKVSAKRNIDKLYKQIGYTGSEEKYVPVQIAPGQWVGRKKEDAVSSPLVETARQYINRRNAEYLDAAKVSPRDGLSKLDEIIRDMEGEGHGDSKAYAQALNRRNNIEKSIVSQERKAQKKEVKAKKKEVKADEKNKQVEPVKGQVEQGPKVTEDQGTKGSVTEVQEPTKEVTSSEKGGQEHGQVQQTENKVGPKQKVEKLRAKAVEARLRAGEDVPQEQVDKFKTLSLRWSRDAEGKWSEHEPEYLTKKTMTPEERERRDDLRALQKAEQQPTKKRDPAEALAASQKELEDLTKELKSEKDPAKREELEDAIASTRRDITILGNRIAQANRVKQIRWFGEAPETEGEQKHPLSTHMLYQSPETNDEVIGQYAELQPDLNRYMLRQMHPATMPKALATLLNRALHFNDGTVDLNMVDTFIKQLDQGLRTHKLDNYFRDPDDRNDYAGELQHLRDYLGKVVNANLNVPVKPKPEVQTVKAESRDEELARLIAEQEEDSKPRFSITEDKSSALLRRIEEDFEIINDLVNGAGILLPDGRSIVIVDSHEDFLAQLKIRYPELVPNVDENQLGNMLLAIGSIRTNVSGFDENDEQNFYVEIPVGLKPTAAQYKAIEKGFTINDEILYDIVDTVTGDLHKDDSGIATSISELKRAIAAATDRYSRPLFTRQSAVAGKKMSVNEVLSAVDNFTQTWTNAPYTIAVENRGQLPDEVKAYIASDADNSRIGGVFHGGSIFLIADELLNDEDVARTMLHEAMGHYGVIETLGDRFRSTCEAIYNSYKGSKEMSEILRLYKLDVTTAEGRQDAGAEYIAAEAEKNRIDQTFWEKVLSGVRTALRSIGINIKFNDNDLKSLLADSKRFLEQESSYNVEDHFSDRREPLFERVNQAPPFYSELIQNIMDRTDVPGKVQSLRKWLNKHSKPAEQKWMGIEQFLEGKDKVTKQELLDFLNQNKIELQEVVKQDTLSNAESVWDDQTPEEVRTRFEEGMFAVTQDDKGEYHGWYYSVDSIENNMWEVNIHKDGEIVHTGRDFDSGEDALDIGLELLDSVVEYSGERVFEDTRSSNPVDSTRYGQYTLPGGKDYKELIFQYNAPKSEVARKSANFDYDVEEVEEDSAEYDRYWDEMLQSHELNNEDEDFYPDIDYFLYDWMPRNHPEISIEDVVRMSGNTLKDKSDIYLAAHWFEPNVLGHVRLDTRYDDQGNSVLFIEEIQSDWLQDAKKHGFNDDEKVAKRRTEAEQLRNRFISTQAALQNETDEDKKAQLEEELNQINIQIDAMGDYADTLGIAKAPFLENWREVFMKRMIRYAVDNGFDRVAWTTGKQQADRYNLAQYIDQLEVTDRRVLLGRTHGIRYAITGSKDGRTLVSRTVSSDKELADIIGKEMAARAIKRIDENNASAIFQGIDLQIGGQGMMSFYDQKLKGFVEKYIKQWGAKLETLKLVEQSSSLKESMSTVFGDMGALDFKSVGPDQWRAQSQTGIYDIGYEQNIPIYYVSFFLNGITEEEEVVGEKLTLADAIKLAHDHYYGTSKALQQPGFTVTPQMRKDVVEKGQPWFSKTGAGTLRALPSTTKTMQGYEVKDYSKVWISNPRAGEYDEHRDFFQPDRLRVDKITGRHYIDQVLKDDGNNTFVVKFKDGGSRTFSEKDFQEMYRKQKALVEKAKPRYRIVDYTDNLTPEEQKQKNLFDDAAYAFMKAAIMQLPKNQPAMHAVERYLLSPEWYKHPVMEKIVKAAVSRHDRYYEMFNGLNEVATKDDPGRMVNGVSNIIDANVALKNKGLDKLQVLKGEVSEGYRQLEKMEDQIDTGEWLEGYDKANHPSWEQHFKGEGVSQEVIDLYKMRREAYDKALDLIIRPMHKLVAEIDAEATKTGTKPRYPSFSMLDDDGKPTQVSLKQVIEHMGQLRGTYSPRLREMGEWVIKGKRGDKVVRYHKPNRVAAELLKRDLQRKGYAVEPIHERERLPEDVYSSLRIINTAKAIELAAKSTSAESPELTAKFIENILQDVADLVRVRGFRSSMVSRSKGAVTHGYITDPNERFVRYINNISAGMAKAEAAEKMFKTLAGHYDGVGEDRKKVEGIDPAKEPRAYDTATQYITEQLRNNDAADRVIGMMKSFATFKYLGFSLRSPIVNVTALVTTVPTVLHEYVLHRKGNFGKIGNEIRKAAGDYMSVMRGKKLMNVDEQLLMDEIKTKGYDTPQYTREALGTIQRSYSKAWAKTLYWSMFIFGKSEQWIRGASMLAAYRLARENNADLSHDEAAEIAHDASNKAHGVYGKATQLAIGQGTGPGARVAQLMYTYQKFGHNYLQMLYDVGVRRGNVKAFLFGLLSPIVLSGAAVIPMKDAILGVAGIMISALGGGADPEKWFWDQFRKRFGSFAERTARHGVLGAMNVDVSSSMSIGVGVPRDFYELLGVGGGLAKDYLQAKEYLEIGAYGRATEKIMPNAVANVFKAIRELNGVTTTKGQRVWNEQGQPYIPSSTETAMRGVLGIRSANEAVMTERTWETKREIKKFATEHDKVLMAWREYIVSRGSAEDLKKVMDMVKRYNDKVISSGKTVEVPLIKQTTLKSQAKMLARPSKSMTVGVFHQ